MQNARGGYTIVEVLIVLVVSLVVFFAAVTVFSGKQGKTEFAQAMRDVESQIQAVINDVRVSTYPDASNYRCIIDPLSQRPALVSGSSQIGTNTNCIFLGKAIELSTTTNPDQLNVYTVLGRRLNGSTPVTTFEYPNPEPNPETMDQLTETYKIIFGATVLSARQDASPATEPAYLMGFYNSLHPTSAPTQGSQSLKTVGYIGPNNFGPGLVKTAIRGLSVATPVNSKIWTICFQSGTSNETAQLVVNSSFS
ncbi:hypothetical protein HYS85_01200, partial [Candidatus Saccharibacteria bacterium]|nr:hypothetical protein [Candidatus Saccharibacteria bacterium]